MAGSKSSSIFSAATLIMFLSILQVPEAQAQDISIVSGTGVYSEDQAKCLSYLADIPGRKDYCKGFLETSVSPSPCSSCSSSSSVELGQWTEDLEKCWSSLKKIEGCVGDILFALFTGDFSKIAHDCCDAVECLLLMFPWNPNFSTALPSFCKSSHQ